VHTHKNNLYSLSSNLINFLICSCCGLAPAGNKEPHGCSTALNPIGVGRRMERKRQKLMVWDKGSLTAQQTKRTVTTVKLIRKIYKTNSKVHRTALNTRCLTRSWATINSPWPARPPGIQDEGTLYWILCLYV